MKLAIYLIGNATLGLCLWLGIIGGIEGATRLALVVAWYHIAVSLFVNNEQVIAKMISRRFTPAVPQWIDVPYHVLIAGFMIWHGWMVTGIAYVLHTILIATAYEKAREGMRSNEPDQDPAGESPFHVKTDDPMSFFGCCPDEPNDHDQGRA